MLRGDPLPNVRSNQIHRPRLVQRLEHRFGVPLTVVVGGAGSGKTTLLAQSLVDDPGRVDVWVSAVGVDDRDRLIGRLLAGLGRGDADPTVPMLVEALLEHTPREVCLCVDDAHRLDSELPLQEILDSLPRNGHLLVASRRRPDLSSQGPGPEPGIVVIDQNELLLTADETIEFARTRGLDAQRLAGAGGWPAFVELAAAGGDAGGREYLEREAARSLEPERLVALARFAFVGGGNDEVCRATSGWSLTELVEGLPLISGELDGVVRPHDLWLELIGPNLTGADQREAAIAAARVLAGRGEYDDAIELVGRVGDSGELRRHMRTACIVILDGGLRADRLGRWRALIPIDAATSPEACFVRGLFERERDPTSTSCWSELEAAAEGFRTAADHEAEIAVLAQLGYITRLRADADALPRIMDRVSELATSGIEQAESFLAFGTAWTAMAIGDRTGQLSALDPLLDRDLPPVWERTRDHLRANALMALGRPEDALDVVPHGLGPSDTGLPGALITEHQCRWYAGQPDAVLTEGVRGLGADDGARDRFVGGTFSAMIHGFAGRADEASRGIRIARAAVGNEPGLFLELQLQLADKISTFWLGDEEPLRQLLDTVFERAPLGSGAAENLLALHCAVPYVLCPDTRSWWDNATLGPLPTRVLAMGKAIAAFREDGDLGPIRRLAWPAPGQTCAVLPVNWAIEIALAGVVAGAPPAHAVAAWACEHWGSPARDVLRRFADGDGPLAQTAASLIVELPAPPELPVRLLLLGPMELRHGGYATTEANWRRERVRALLLYLALNRSATRERVAEELWPDLERTKADKNLRTTLSYLHGVLEPARGPRDAPFCVRNDTGMLTLHPSTDVDLWRMDTLIDRALALEQEGTPSLALEVLLEAVALWRGELAAGEADHQWADLERTRVRSRFVRAATRCSELLVATGRPDEAISICHRAITADRWFEPAYAALARAYLDLGDVTSARSTIAAAEKAMEALGLPLSVELGRLRDEPGS